MKRTAETTTLTFVLDNEQTLQNIDHLKLHDYERFKFVNHLGTELLAAAKDNDVVLHNLIRNCLIVFSKSIICSSPSSNCKSKILSNYQTIEYFLKNGFKIANTAEEAPLTICYSLQYLRGPQAPIDLLKLVLQYGANPRIASQRDSQTPMHIASQYGEVQFLKTLIEYGADINAVNDDRQTPLGVALRFKRQKAVDFLKGKGASQKWNY